MRTSADHAEYDYHAGPPAEMEQAEQIAAELERLEREIGRAYCHAVAIERLFDCLSDAFTRYDIKTDQADADAFEMIGEMLHAERTVLRGYHARYRALLAAGAEAATGGEEAR